MKIVANHDGAIEILNQLYPDRNNDKRELQDSEIINGYRDLADRNNNAPTEKTSDENILKIYKTIRKHFNLIATEKNEILTTGQINTIAYKFMQLLEMAGPKVTEDHLRVELDRYKTEGLRDDYKFEIQIDTFDFL